MVEITVVLPLLLRRPLLLLKERLLRLRERRRSDRGLVRRRGDLLRGGTSLRYVWLLIRCSGLGLIRVVCGLRWRRRRLRNRRGRLLGLEVLLRLVLLLLLPVTILLVAVSVVRVQRRLVRWGSCSSSLSRLRSCRPLLSTVSLRSSCVLSGRSCSPVSRIVWLRRLRRGRTWRQRRLLGGIRSSRDKGVFVHRHR